MHSPSLSGRPMSHKMVVVNEWTGVVRTPTSGPMIISSSLTGWPIGFLISAGNPTLPIFTVPSFAGQPMGLLVCASLAGPSYQVPSSLAGRCGCSPVYHCWPMVARPVLRWLAHYTKSLPRWLADRPGCLYFTGWPIIPSPSLAGQADG